MTRTRTVLTIPLLGLIALAGCDDTSSSSSGDGAQSTYGRAAQTAENTISKIGARDAQTATAAGSGDVVTVAGVDFRLPNGWTIVTPDSSVRAAQVSIPGDPKAVIYWSYFGPGTRGGDVNANIDRWETQVLDSTGQAASAHVDTTTNDAGHTVTLVMLDGTFLDGQPMGSKTDRTDWALRGAIIESPNGNIFIKFTGPADTVADYEDTFFTMAEQSTN